MSAPLAILVGGDALSSVSVVCYIQIPHHSCFFFGDVRFLRFLVLTPDPDNRLFFFVVSAMAAVWVGGGERRENV